MAVFQSVKERIGAVNGLGCLLPALENQLITFDLENESIVTGIVKEVDGLMNTVIDKAQIVSLDGYCQHCEMLYLKGRIIRYVHIPKQFVVRETIARYLRKSKKVQPTEQRTARSRFRQNKLQRYQEESKMSAARIKENRSQTESNV